MFKSQANVQPDYLPRVYETGIYPAVIDMAYLDQSKSRVLPDGSPAGEAYSLTLVFKTGDGREHKETLWITSGRDKGQLTYYIDKKSGEKRDLPGFAIANAVAMLSLGKELGDLTPEDKMVSIYDYTAKKEIPVSKSVYTELIGQKVNLGIRKITDFKTAKNESTGAYEPTTETRDYNEIEHVFKADTNQSMYEFTNGKDPQYADAWVSKNAGKTKDKTAVKTTKPGAAPAAGTGAAKPLFGQPS